MKINKHLLNLKNRIKKEYNKVFNKENLNDYSDYLLLTKDASILTANLNPIANTLSTTGAITKLIIDTKELKEKPSFKETAKKIINNLGSDICWALQTLSGLPAFGIIGSVFQSYQAINNIVSKKGSLSNTFKLAGGISWFIGTLAISNPAFASAGYIASTLAEKYILTKEENKNANKQN